MEIRQTSSLLTFYPDKKNRVEISCPECRFKMVVDATPYADKNRILNVKCKCGISFKCNVDFRKFYRKRVNFAGGYELVKSGKRGDMLVENLSVEGIGFVNMTPHQLSAGDILRVNFRLDDTERSEVRRKVKIVGLHGDCVNTEFTEANRYDSALGFYLKR